MEKVVYFQDVAPQICAFVWVAVAVLSAFLVYELVWRQKHPQAAAGKLTSAEKKSRFPQTVFCFCFSVYVDFGFCQLSAHHNGKRRLHVCALCADLLGRAVFVLFV